MKPSFKHPFKSLTGVIAFGLLAGSSISAQALTWDGGSGTWDNNLMNWNGGTASWVAGGLAQFPNTGAATVTIGDNLDIGTLDFNTAGSGPYTFQNTTPGYTIDFTGAGIITSTANVQLVNSSGFINFNNSASAGNSTIQVSSNGEVHFLNTSSAGTAVITNAGGLLAFEGNSTASGASIDNAGGILEFRGAATGGTANIVNGGFLDITNATGTVTIGALNNNSGGLGGAVVLGKNKLQLTGDLTLSTIPQNLLDFTLDTPTTSGTISLTAGSNFFGSGDGQVDINLSAIGPVAAGTYTLIDWTGSAASGVDLLDFGLTGPLPAGLSGATLVINGSQLQLVAVPEPATLAMPFAAALGMLWLRRRAARMAV